MNYGQEWPEVLRSTYYDYTAIKLWRFVGWWTGIDSVWGHFLS
jgi:hypothetical protein